MKVSALGMPTLGRQEVSAPSWGNLPSPNNLLPASAPAPPLLSASGLLPQRYFPKPLRSSNLSLTPAITAQQREDLAMQKQLGKVGAIRREVHGKACQFCGGRTYQLILRASNTSDHAGLSARCTHCHRARGLDEDLGKILWM